MRNRWSPFRIRRIDEIDRCWNYSESTSSCQLSKSSGICGLNWFYLVRTWISMGRGHAEFVPIILKPACHCKVMSLKKRIRNGAKRFWMTLKISFRQQPCARPAAGVGTEVCRWGCPTARTGLPANQDKEFVIITKKKGTGSDRLTVINMWGDKRQTK